MYDIVNEIRRFAYEDSETVGRDILERRLLDYADRVQKTCDAIVAHYDHRIARQAASMAATARLNCQLREMLKKAETQKQAPKTVVVGVDLASKPSETVYHVSSYSPEMGWFCEYLGTDEEKAKEAYAKAKRLYDKVDFEKEQK